MKSLQLTKASDGHILSHIYEHVFCTLLELELIGAGFCPLIDYSLDGFTDDGAVRIELESYRDELDLEYFVQQINDREIGLDTLVVPFLQVYAEYDSRLYCDKSSLLLSEIQQFHRFSWQNSQQFATKVKLDTSDKITTREMVLRINFSEEDKALWPLLRIVGGVKLNYLVEILANNHGGYISSSTFATDDEGLTMTVKLSEEAYPDVPKLEIPEPVLDRLLAQLQNVKAMHMPPKSRFTYRGETREITPEYWREMATRENVGTLDLSVRVDTC